MSVSGARVAKLGGALRSGEARALQEDSLGAAGTVRTQALKPQTAQANEKRRPRPVAAVVPSGDMAVGVPPPA